MRYCLIRFVLVVTCVTGSALPALAQAVQAAEFGTGLKVADYKTLGLLIEDLPDGAREIGLTRNRLRTRLELRFRQAGLVPLVPSPSTAFGPYLYVQVLVINSAYTIHLSFLRRVSFLETGREYTVVSAKVWWNGSLGSHGGSSEYIVADLDLLLDKFLNEYLKVNQG